MCECVLAVTKKKKNTGLKMAGWANLPKKGPDSPPIIAPWKPAPSKTQTNQSTVSLEGPEPSERKARVKQISQVILYAKNSVCKKQS